MCFTTLKSGSVPFYLYDEERKVTEQVYPVDPETRTGEVDAEGRQQSDIQNEAASLQNKISQF